jgi:hypothetical protein
MGSARLFSDDIRLTAKGVSYGLQHGLLRPQLLLHQLLLDLFAELLKQPWRRWIVDRVPPPKIAETGSRSFFRRFRHGASLDAGARGRIARDIAKKTISSVVSRCSFSKSWMDLKN